MSSSTLATVDLPSSSTEVTVVDNSYTFPVNTATSPVSLTLDGVSPLSFHVELSLDETTFDSSFLETKTIVENFTFDSSFLETTTTVENFTFDSSFLEKTTTVENFTFSVESSLEKSTVDNPYLP